MLWDGWSFVLHVDWKAFVVDCAKYKRRLLLFQNVICNMLMPNVLFKNSLQLKTSTLTFKFKFLGQVHLVNYPTIFLGILSL